MQIIESIPTTVNYHFYSVVWIVLKPSLNVNAVFFDAVTKIVYCLTVTATSLGQLRLSFNKVMRSLASLWISQDTCVRK